MPGIERTISFRHLFATELAGFLQSEGLGYESALVAIGEIVIALARYREEGEALFPEVFVCHDATSAMEKLGGNGRVTLGTTTLDSEGVRLALKRAAPLSSPGWCVLFEVHASENAIHYGLTRIDPFVLKPRAMDRLREAEHRCDNPLLGIAQMAENVIELRSSRDVFRHVYLSGARTDDELGPMVVDRLTSRLGADLAPNARDAVRAFWRRILGDALRSSHGSLVAVVRSESEARTRFPDASHLDPVVDIAAKIETYLSRHDEGSRSTVQGLASLVSGMLRADGITVLRGDGAVLACEAFIAHGAHASRAGGARRRTYETLAADVASGTLLAAFYRSQDGAAKAT